MAMSGADGHPMPRFRGWFPVYTLMELGAACRMGEQHDFEAVAWLGPAE
jgi:hypothetical protein